MKISLVCIEYLMIDMQSIYAAQRAAVLDALLTLSALVDCWVKLSADDILKHFSYFSRKQDFAFHANCLQCNGDNLHEMSNHVFWEKKTKTKKTKTKKKKKKKTNIVVNQSQIEVQITLLHSFMVVLWRKTEYESLKFRQSK